MIKRYFTMCSCIMDGLHGLCRECDRVFHKSATKRGHVRLPVLTQGSMDVEISLEPQESLGRHFDQADNVDCLHFPAGAGAGTEPFVLTGHCQWKASAYTKYAANVLCLLLHRIRMLIDDRRVCPHDSTDWVPTKPIVVCATPW